MRILVTDGMDKTAMAELKAQGHEVVEQFYEPAELGQRGRRADQKVWRRRGLSVRQRSAGYGGTRAGSGRRA